MKNTTLKIMITTALLAASSYIPLVAAQSAPQAGTQTYVPGDQHWSQNAAPSNLTRDQILSSNVGTWSKVQVDDGRVESIQVAAVSLGSQAGMAARAREIEYALMNRANQYDKAFNFSAIMLEPGFLPPVITQGIDAYNQPNDNEARASDCVFRIERPARIVSASPTWRTYLLGNSTPAVRPDASVLPKTAEEKRLWDEWAATGWNQGARQADENFAANLARLRQDMQGMIRFKMLYEQGLVSKPKLSRSFLGVTGGGDEMAVNDRIIRITQKSALDANTKNWSSSRPVIDSKTVCQLR